MVTLFVFFHETSQAKFSNINIFIMIHNNSQCIYDGTHKFAKPSVQMYRNTTEFVMVDF